VKAIIISDADARALLNKLELTKFRSDHSKCQTVAEIHRAFHYEVCLWLQEQGADCVGRG
jgi:hypothetical protein